MERAVYMYLMRGISFDIQYFYFSIFYKKHYFFNHILKITLLKSHDYILHSTQKYVQV